MLNKIISGLVFVFIVQTSFGQAGYLGHLNSIEAKVNFSPTIYKTTTLDLNDLTYAVRYRGSFTSYQLKYNRVINKFIELSVGYRYSNMALIAYNKSLDYKEVGDYIVTKRFLGDPKIINHGGDFTFKYYRKGSFAPIGKFTGLNLSFQNASLLNGSMLTIGKVGSYIKDESNFFKKSYETDEVIDYEIKRDIKVKMVAVSGVMGRNYPITNRLLISGYLTFPLISYFLTSRGNYFGFSSNNISNYNDDSMSNMLAFTMKKYNRATLEIGLKYSL